MNRAAILCTTAALFFSGLAAAAEAQQLDRAEIRAAARDLAANMEESYVFPDIARNYAERLRERAESGNYDALTDPAQLAAALQSDLRAVHADAHLRVGVNDRAPLPEGQTVRMMSGEEAIVQERWLGDGVAYVRFNVLPSDEASQQRMAAILDQFADARALILDVRGCRGGSLEVMDILFSRLYAEPTRLLNMDTRTGANPEMEAEFAAVPDLLRREDAPAGITRFVHWAVPTSPVHSLSDARVYVLTDRTASACEHLSLALKNTGRATLVGGTTRGAGHYGGEQTFGDDRFFVWLPIGRTYVAETNQDWEGVGVAPDRAVAPADALNVVLAELGVAQSTASAEVDQAPAPMMRRVEAAPGQRRYGIALTPPQGGEQSLPIVEVVAGNVAAEAGVRAGDRILSLNGTPVSQIPPGEFINYMRSPQLVMVVDRAGQQLTFEMSLTG
jgi:C-terminal processing protease CtpA/Prc